MNILLVNLRKFIENDYTASLCLMKRDGVLTHRHLQMVVKGDFTSLLVFSKRINYFWYGTRVLHESS